MPLVALRPLLDHAAEHSYAIPAFNVNNLEQIKAIMAAANASNSPVILQASRGARKYAGDAFLRALVHAAAAEYPHLPLVLHQDHGNSPATCQSAIEQGFTSVMMDGSLLEDGTTPSDFDYNVNVTRQVVAAAHPTGISVEGELGCLGSLETGQGEQEDGHGATGTLSHDQLLTPIEDALAFVDATQVDALAIAIGTSHGAYKFSKPPTEETLAIGHLAKLHQALPNTHFVLHGASSVPQELVERINAHGGALKPAYGVPLQDIQRAIQYGVRKVNIDTDNRLAMTAAMRQHMHDNPADFDPRGYLTPAITAMTKVCTERFEAFGCAGQADKVA